MDSKSKGNSNKKIWNKKFERIENLFLELQLCINWYELTRRPTLGIHILDYYAHLTLLANKSLIELEL